MLVSTVFFQNNLLYAQNYGLGFWGQESLKDDRTELNLSPKKAFRFDNTFTLSFDLKFESGITDRYGYIVRIIQNDTTNIDLVYNENLDNGIYFFNLISGQHSAELPFTIQDPVLIQNWIPFQIKFNFEMGTVTLTASDTLVSSTTLSFQKKNSYKIVFGASNHENFKTRDVPQLNLKDVKIFEGAWLRHHWPLNEISGLVAKDKISRKNASIRNPDWLKPKHENWIKVFGTNQRGYTQVAVDQANEIVYLISTDHMIAYSIQDNSYKKILYSQSIDLLPGCQAFYNSLDSSIYSYIVDDQSFSSFNLSKGIWEIKSKKNNQETTFLHHNKYFSPSDTSLYIFGGYGRHEYKSSLQKLSLVTNQWSFIDTKGDLFYPRYLAASGNLGDTVYILGGLGSASGDQMVNPKPYKHLMAYSLSAKQFVRKFDLNLQENDLCYSNSMVLNEASRAYHTLAFPVYQDESYLQLMKGSLNTPDMELMGDKLPYFFHDTKSYADLFYFPKCNKFVAYTSFTEENLNTSIQLYTLHYPPNTSLGTLKLKHANISRYPDYLLILIISGIASIIIFIVYRKRNKGEKSNVSYREIHDTSPKSINSNETNNTGLKHKSSMLFFGGFQVYDRNGIEITGDFTPLLKELFLIIWLHTLKNDKGISSERLTETLWFDKSPRSARNNKSVNITKIRNILKRIGDCEVTHKTGYWKINCQDKKVYNDYLDLLKITETKTNLSKLNVQRLIQITEQGPFLRNLNYDWLDEFKASVYETIIEALYSFAKKQNVKKDASLIIQVAECIFNCDSINEEAMILKSKAHFEMGAHSLSQSTYTKFCKDYQRLYGQEYNKSFADITRKPLNEILTF